MIYIIIGIIVLIIIIWFFLSLMFSETAASIIMVSFGIVIVICVVYNILKDAQKSKQLEIQRKEREGREREARVKQQIIEKERHEREREDREKQQKIEDAKPVTNKLLILPQVMTDDNLIASLREVGYSALVRNIKNGESITHIYQFNKKQHEEIIMQIYQLNKAINVAERTGKKVAGGKQETMNKIKKLETERDAIRERQYGHEKRIIQELKTKNARGYIEILLSAPQKEEHISIIFSRYNIKILTDAQAIEKYKKDDDKKEKQLKEKVEKQLRAVKKQLKEEKAQQEKEWQYKTSISTLCVVLLNKVYFDTYKYFISAPQCKLAIGNFIKQNSKAMENIILENKYDDIFIETVSMLTNVLIENAALDLNIAKEVTFDAIITTLLNGWIDDFKEKNNSFCEEMNITDKDEIIRLFAYNFDKSKTPQKTIYSFFLLLNNIKIDYNTDISDLRKIYKEFESELNHAYDEIQEKAVYENFKTSMLTYSDANSGGENFTIDDIDLMDGKEFEQYIAKLFAKMGYITEVTKHSGDQGIDVIAKKGNTSIGIQAKCYSGTVGNSAVQEAASGKALYKVDKVMVITNNEFTSAAKELAQANNVILWDRNILKDKVVQYPI